MFDCHSHILPGIDDGAETLEDTLELARQSVASGVTHIVATPHASSQNLLEVLGKREQLIETVRSRLAEEKIPLTIVPGIEYCADGHSAAMALEHPECLCGVADKSDRPILVELPWRIELQLASNLLFMGQLKNVSVILAHPERYSGFMKGIDFLKDLLDRGMYLQFNSSSFKKSLFSFRLCDRVLDLIRHCPERVLIGSDAHHPKHRPGGLDMAHKAISSAISEEVWQLVSEETPRSLLL